MSDELTFILTSDDALTIKDLIKRDAKQNKRHQGMNSLYSNYNYAYGNSRHNTPGDTQTLKLEYKHIEEISLLLFNNNLEELHDKFSDAVNTALDILRNSKPSYQTHHGATISAYHLSQQTLSDYIRVIANPNDEKQLTLPRYDLPSDFYLTSNGDTTSIINLGGSHIGLKLYANKYPETPQDLLDLLHWMYDKDYSFVTLTMWCEGARGYSENHRNYILQTETFLPFYDLDKVNTIFQTPCDTPEKQAIYNHIDIRQIDIEMVWDDDYVATDVSDLFPDTDFSSKATRRKFYYSSDEIYSAAKYVLESTVYCPQARARTVFTDAEKLAEWLNKQRVYSKKPRLAKADRHIISLDLATQILKAVGGTAWEVKTFSPHSKPAFTTYYCTSTGMTSNRFKCNDDNEN